MFNLRQDVLEKNKILSQLFDSSTVLNSEPKTVIQTTNIRLLKEEDSMDVTDQDPKTDTVITSTMEEKQHKLVRNGN